MCKLVKFRFVAALLAILSPVVVAAETVAVIMQTSAGEVRLELYSDEAPLTVENFLEYVDGNYYDNAYFYRVVRMDNQAQNKIKIEVIQGGLGMEAADSSFAPIAHETTQATGILHKDGVISMARGEPGTTTSEFFICINEQPELDFGGTRNPDGQGFAAFGKVVKGMGVIRRIQNMSTDTPAKEELEYTSGQILIDPVVIHGISRVVN